MVNSTGAYIKKSSKYFEGNDINTYMKAFEYAEGVRSYHFEVYEEYKKDINDMTLIGYAVPK